MRTVYSAIFVGFAVVGFAGVFNPHSPGMHAAMTNSSPAHLLAAAAEPSKADSTIVVQTELVQPVVVQELSSDRPENPDRVTPMPRRRATSARALRAPRSRLARLVFGDGQFRPQPFPTPASGLK